MDAIFCIHIKWYNQSMVLLLTLKISSSFFKFICKYFEAYSSGVWSKHNLSIVCPFSDIIIGGILGKCNVNFEGKRVFALACCRLSDKGDYAKKSEQEETGGRGGVGFPPYSLSLFSTFTTPLSISCHSTQSERHGKYPWISFLVERSWFFIFFYFNLFTPGNLADQRNGRWVVGHGNFQGNVSWFFAFFSGVLDWIVLNLVWFQRSLYFSKVSGQSCPWTDDVTSGRMDVNPHGRIRAAQGWINVKVTFLVSLRDCSLFLPYRPVLCLSLLSAVLSCS